MKNKAMSSRNKSIKKLINWNFRMGTRLSW